MCKNRLMIALVLLFMLFPLNASKADNKKVLETKKSVIQNILYIAKRQNSALNIILTRKLKTELKPGIVEKIKS